MSADVQHTIPIVIGVTGHREIREQDLPAIRRAVKAELKKLQTRYPHSPLLMLSSLAQGGDLLCADISEELGIPLAAILPREQKDYQQDFSPDAAARFSHHCSRAGQVFVAPCIEEIPEAGISRDYQFRQSGIYVSTHCHILLALWDGHPGTHGCGTGDAVDFVLNGSYKPVSGAVLRSGSNEAVIHIFTPRSDAPEEAAGTVHILGNQDAVQDILHRTDAFNRSAASVSMEAGSRLPSGSSGDPVLNRMETISRLAGRLSRQAAKQYRLVLVFLAVASALLTFAFLMYDEAQAIWMILVCGAMLAAAWICRRYAVHSDCHRCYIEYRVLAECLRVQTYLRYAGSHLQAAELFSWTQQEETAWVMNALFVLTIGPPQETEHEIRTCWVQEQRDYHRAASRSAGKKLKISDNVVHFALILSVVLYLAAVEYEILCGGLLFQPSVLVADVEFWRTILKIVLGTISAVTLFIAGFYGRLSLPRTFSDHQKMERFYSSIDTRLEKYGQTEDLLSILAREELIENGNWCSYQRDNTPDISI
ncbi:MAG: hypothetical protein J5949_09470 [Oscillospiraceae bacterium]|nr:hypothetical protein [Oscillospiraceae bacterium]